MDAINVELVASGAKYVGPRAKPPLPAE